jgi:hypothetical protein
MAGKRLSAFSREFWVERGCSIEQADYERNSRRPIRKEYWIKKGYSEEESKLKAIETKKNNSIKGAKKSSERIKEEVYLASPRRKEYWIKKGYSEEESIKKVSEGQSTFSLQKCIEKYGLLDGTNRWKIRQEKWQNTLKNKTENDIIEMNKKKNPFSLSLFENKEECVSYFNNKFNMKLVLTLDNFYRKIENHLIEIPYLKYSGIGYYMKIHVTKIQLEILELPLEIIRDKISDLFPDTSLYLMIKGKYQSFRKRIDEGLLRSSYEIYFYEKLKEKFPNTSFTIEGKYKNSNMRYDFNVFDDYIEICPLYGQKNQEKYTMKMDKKSNLFNSILLKSTKEIDEYLEGKNASRVI